MSLNSDEEKARVLHSCLKSPDFRIFSPAVYLKFLFSYGNIQGKACKSERGNTDFIESTRRKGHLLGSWRKSALATFANTSKKKKNTFPHL